MLIFLGSIDLEEDMMGVKRRGLIGMRVCCNQWIKLEHEKNIFRKRVNL